MDTQEFSKGGVTSRDSTLFPYLPDGVARLTDFHKYRGTDLARPQLPSRYSRSTHGARHRLVPTGGIRQAHQSPTHHLYYRHSHSLRGTDHRHRDALGPRI